MDKNAIKKYAIWARRELISRVSQKAAQYAIIDGDIADANAETINGIVLTNVEKTQRRNLIAKIKEKGYEQVMEEVAYTWFNRFCALRFMEVNNYLPSHVRVFTNEENEFRPQIIDEAIHLELEGLNMQKVYAFKETNDNEGLYKYLVITQCNALGKILPGMFEHISDYTELLFPDNILREGSIIEQMIALIPQEDWQDAVQIIGWLYQYYNSEPKDKVFADLKKNIKISKENIPAATQLFTPDWIVRYMVENSVGRWYYDGMQGWLQDSPDVNRLEVLKSNWKYYLDEAEQIEEVQAELDKLRSEKCPDLDEFKVIDPCMGSGHILVYAFDVLMQIYESCGYSSRDAVKNIIEKNLYGLDIDERAAQLAYFVVMMKARQYDRRFFTREIRPNVYAIPESNNIDKFVLDDFIDGNETIKENIGSILSDMYDAKEYGSIINVAPVDFECLYTRISEMINSIGMFTTNIKTDVLVLIKVAEILSQKYDVVVTNPPYMGGSMNSKLYNYLKEYYPDSKLDMFAVFIEKCLDFSKRNGKTALVTPETWMFLSTYASLREKILNMTNISSLSHFGLGAFDAGFGTVAFVLEKEASDKNHIGTFKDFRDVKEKEETFKDVKTLFVFKQLFFDLPDHIIAYWCSPKMVKLFSNPSIGENYELESGIVTGSNIKFLRLWHEVDAELSALTNPRYEMLSSGEKKWFKCNKGGGFHKWYGNYEYVVDIGSDAKNIKTSIDSSIYRLRKPENYFLQGINWPLIGVNKFSAKVTPYDVINNKAANSIHFRNEIDFCLFGYLNSCVYNALLNMLNPTVNYPLVNIANSPYDKTDNITVSSLVKSNIEMAKSDWDSFETSWDFKKHPLLNHFVSAAVDIEKKNNNHWLIENNYKYWVAVCEDRFNLLKANEEELNRIFIDIYGLQDELSPDVSEEDITVRKADLQRDIKSFISYAVGCMLGRYSLYQEGLFYAGGYWDSGSKIDLTYDLAKKCGIEKSSDVFIPDYDNIIPICDDEYFEDDIVGKFVKFVETVYGKDTLEENLQFIADALGGKGANPKDVIRKYFLNDFFADHCKIYQKRPIYWLFDSGKKNGFKALVYMHRYREDTIARMRTDYVHEQQSRYRTAIEEAEHQMLSAKDSERVKITKVLNKLKEQDEELRVYEEKIHHLADQMIRIDLDDGVRNNYELFKDVLAKIK